MKGQKIRVQIGNKNQSTLANQTLNNAALSKNVQQLSQQRSPFNSGNLQNLDLQNHTQDQKSVQFGEQLLGSKVHIKGQLKGNKNVHIKKMSVALPSISGNNNQKNNIASLTVSNTFGQQNQTIQDPPYSFQNQQQHLSLQINKQSDQYSMIYKQKVQKQNEVIKRRIFENASLMNSNYIPIPSKMQESSIQLNANNLKIMGTSNQQKLPAIQEQLKHNSFTPTPLKSTPKLIQKNNSTSSQNQNYSKNNIFSQPNSQTTQSTIYTLNTIVDRNKSHSLVLSKNNSSTPKQNINTLNTIQLTSNSMRSNNLSVGMSTSINQQNFDTNGSTLNQNTIQSLSSNKDGASFTDLTISKGKGRSKKHSISTNKGVKFSMDGSQNITLQKQNESGNRSTQSAQIENKSRSNTEEISGILKNKRQDSTLNYKEQQGKAPLAELTEVEETMRVHQVLSRKSTQNNQELERQLSTQFTGNQQRNNDLVENNLRLFDDDLENDDSFEEEERKNEMEEQENQGLQDQEYTIVDEQIANSENLTELLKAEIKQQEAVVADDVDDDAATISYKQQFQQQLSEKHKNKGILKTLATQGTKKNAGNTVPTYYSRIDSIQLLYSKQEQKITVYHKITKSQFIIDIYTDDTGGGRYDWKINDVMLGAGSQGRVYKAFCSKNVKNFALKMINLNDFEDNTAKDVINEILLLKCLRGCSPFIQLHDAFGLEKMNQKTIVLVMEYCQCNLMEVLNYRKSEKMHWTEEELMHIFKQMLDSVKLMSEKNICHRDLKMQNILFSAKDIKYKVGDFSEGKFIQSSTNQQTPKENNVKSEQLQEDEEDNKMDHSFRGTWKYLSPELSLALSNVQDICSYDPFTSDLYSLGVLFADLLSLDEIKFQTKTLNGDRSQNNSNYMTQIRAFMTACIQKNLKPRACQLILTLLNEVPSYRKAYESIIKGYEIDVDINAIVLTQDKEISLEIESRRENSKIMSSYQKAKKLYIIAEGYEKIFKYEKAVEAYLQVLQFTTYMNTKTIRSRTLYNIARCYEKLGLLLKSLEYFQQCYFFRRKIYKPESRRMGEILNGLGIAHNKLGNQQEAKNYYEQSLSIALNRYGENHLIIANMYNNLGSVYFNLQQYSKSTQNFEQAINILRRINLEGQTQQILNNLSMVYLQQQKYDESEYCLKLAIDIVKKYEGEDNYNLMYIYINLGNLNYELKKQEDTDQEYKDRQLKAIGFYKSAEQLCIKFYGEQQFQLGEIYNLMGLAYMNLQDYEQSLYYLLKSESVLEFSKNQNILWQTYCSLGSLHNLQRLFEKSIFYFKKSLEIHDQIDSDILKKADISYNIGCVYLYNKNINDATYWLKKSLDLYQQIDETHYNVEIIHKFLKKIEQFNLDLKD